MKPSTKIKDKAKQHTDAWLTKHEFQSIKKLVEQHTVKSLRMTPGCTPCMLIEIKALCSDAGLVLNDF